MVIYVSTFYRTMVKYLANRFKTTYCIVIILFTLSQDVLGDDWEGSWFPFSPHEGTVDPNPLVIQDLNDKFDHHGRRKMGLLDECDDAETHLEIDWDMNPSAYICLRPKQEFEPRSDVVALHTSELIPRGYSAPHVCINESIQYQQTVPTFGPHRPNWAQYGEYFYVPTQRWLHNLEHGGIVMLYHPCADRNQIRLLRKLVTRCLYRHVITPLNELSPARPLALVVWGHRLEMSMVDPSIVIDFIKQFALKGPEKTHKDGYYTLMLNQHAAIVSDINDSVLCPYYQ